MLTTVKRAEFHTKTCHVSHKNVQSFTQKHAMLCMLYTIAILDKQDVCVMCNIFLEK